MAELDDLWRDDRLIEAVSRGDLPDLSDPAARPLLALAGVAGSAPLPNLRPHRLLAAAEEQRGRRYAVRSLAVAVAVVATLSTSGVAAVVTGDPLRPAKAVWQHLQGGSRVVAPDDGEVADSARVPGRPEPGAPGHGGRQGHQARAAGVQQHTAGDAASAGATPTDPTGETSAGGPSAGEPSAGGLSAGAADGDAAAGRPAAAPSRPDQRPAGPGSTDALAAGSGEDVEVGDEGPETWLEPAPPPDRPAGRSDDAEQPEQPEDDGQTPDESTQTPDDNGADRADDADGQQPGDDAAPVGGDGGTGPAAGEGARSGPNGFAESAAGDGLLPLTPATGPLPVSEARATDAGGPPRPR